MIKPSQVATIIAGAILSARLFLLGLDPATAGPVAASSVAATPPPAAAEPATGGPRGAVGLACTTPPGGRRAGGGTAHARLPVPRRARSNFLARDGSSG